MLCTLIILPILLIVRTCKIDQTVSDSIQHLLKRLSQLPGGQSPIFSTSYIFLLLPNCCLCVLNSLSCHSGLSLHVILDLFLFLFVIQKVHFLSSLCRKLFFGSQTMQCTYGSDSFSFQAVLAFIHLMTSPCGLIGQFAIPTSWKWWKVLFRSIDHCSLTMLLREMLDVARSGRYGGKLRLLCHCWYLWSTWISKIYVLTVTKKETVVLTI